MVKCSFCTKNIEIGTGKIYVQKTGKILNFCSMKCEKNVLKLKRNPLKFKWTKQKEE
jgi:large subunit ribosomal protein L24e